MEKIIELLELESKFILSLLEGKVILNETINHWFQTDPKPNKVSGVFPPANSEALGLTHTLSSSEDNSSALLI